MTIILPQCPETMKLIVHGTSEFMYIDKNINLKVSMMNKIIMLLIWKLKLNLDAYIKYYHSIIIHQCYMYWTIIFTCESNFPDLYSCWVLTNTVNDKSIHLYIQRFPVIYTIHEECMSLLVNLYHVNIHLKYGLLTTGPQLWVTESKFLNWMSHFFPLLISTMILEPQQQWAYETFP